LQEEVNAAIRWLLGQIRHRMGRGSQPDSPFRIACILQAFTPSRRLPSVLGRLDACNTTWPSAALRPSIAPL
jgi:hypothetical protein